MDNGSGQDAYWSPEMIDQAMRLGGISEEERILDEQMQRALALREPSGEQYYGLTAGVLGGLKHINDAILSNVKEKQLGTQREALGKEKKAARRGQVDAYADWQKEQMAQAQALRSALTQGQPMPAMPQQQQRHGPRLMDHQLSLEGY